MLDLVTTTQFRKDLKKLRKRGADMQKLDDVLQMLCAEKQLPERYRDHALVGDYIGFRECHNAGLVTCVRHRQRKTDSDRFPYGFA